MIPGGIVMKLKEIMTRDVIRIGAEESVAVAARTLTHYNIGSLPVCDGQGRLCGLVTDRDLVTRCLASGRAPEKTRVREIMTGGVISAAPDMEVDLAAHLMGRRQIRRLPVVEEGKLLGMVSLGDLACYEETNMNAADALEDICANISER